MDTAVATIKKDISEPPVTEDKATKFNTEEVIALLKETVENTIPDTEYSHAKVSTWHATVVETCLKKLKEMNKNYKYIVTCAIMQKTGAGFYTGSSVYWDNQRDGKYRK
ncbi:Dynein light chain Tctex-type [Apophysomyces ossiformis]|uniref:Dynein light chain Tctex-type n=1 Tax=Apophysomyces ossiformis TaxID=679940 RepID=A0A8H7BMS9_9FUNG|nr:Dynein light chain Tctex-type [Apophysomyces ossiformis]